MRAGSTGATRSPQVARDFNAMADRLAEYRSSSLGELLQAQHAAQATIDSLHRSGGGADARGRAAQRQPGGEPSARHQRRGGQPTRSAALEPAPQGGVQRLRRACAHGQGRLHAQGAGGGDRRGHARRAALPALARQPGARRVGRRRRADGRDAGRDAPAPLRRAEERPGGHGGARVPHAAHLAAHGHPPVRRRHRRPAHAQAGRPALRRARGLRAAAGHRRRPARPVAHPGRAHRDPRARRAVARAARGHARHRTASLARDKGVTLELGAPMFDRAVHADPERLNLVLTNLVTNAIRHTPAGGHVQLRSAPHAPAAGALRGDRQRRRHRRPSGCPTCSTASSASPARRRAAASASGSTSAKRSSRPTADRSASRASPGHGSIFWFTLPAAPQLDANAALG